MKEYFNFSASQRKGMIILLVLILAISYMHLALPHMIRYPKVDHSLLIEQVERISDSIKTARNSNYSVKDSSKKKKKVFRQTSGAHDGYKRKDRADTVTAFVNINLADSAGLTVLPGIGPVFAGRIVRYRELVGGFHDPWQLLEVYGMDSTRLKGFINRIEVYRHDIRTININRAGFREVLRHPYLEYEDVLSIFRLRDQTGIIPNIRDLDSLFQTRAAWWQKVAPYIQCGNP